MYTVNSVVSKALYLNLPFMGALNLNVQNLHSDQSIPYTMLYTRNSDVALCRFALLTAVLRSARSLTVTFALIAVTMLVALPLAHIARGVLISSLCSRAQFGRTRVV